MPNMTLSISEELHKKLKPHSELKWSDVARRALEKKVNELEFMEKILEKSNLTEADADEIAHNINAELRKRLSRNKVGKSRL